MTGPNEFDWSILDDSLAGAEKNNMHIVLRVFVHFPKKPLRVPQWLLDQGIELRNIGHGEKSPQYDDPKLLEAFRQFIQALGAKYDGHRALAFVQLGLLGKWGEWHTYPEKGLLSDATKDKVVGWYKKAFQITPLQVRKPLASAYEANMGLHDDSFGFSTLDGPYNGGEHVSWFFWSRVKEAGQQDFWRKGVMGGETRPEIQGEIFESSYQAGTPFKQDFFKCVDVTHATYMFHHNAFQLGEPITGNELQTALDAHVEMGYNYRVSKVAATSNGSSKVTVDVTVEQIGVAPFYYALNLVLKCDGTTESVPGVEKLIATGDSKVFSFTNIPAESQCLNKIEILLDTDRAHAARPVRFAQGKDGRVTLSLPVPEGGNTTPSNPKPPVAPPSDPSNGNGNGGNSNKAKFFVDAGPENEDKSIVSGNTWQNYAEVSISKSGKYGKSVFQTHRWGNDFTYTFSGLTPGSSQEVTLGFAETYSGACSKGARVFDIKVNGQVFASNLDVFAKAGCNIAFVLAEIFEVKQNGELAINFKAKVENAMVSFIEIEPSAQGRTGGSNDLGFWAIIVQIIMRMFFGRSGE